MYIHNCEENRKEIGTVHNINVSNNCGSYQLFLTKDIIQGLSKLNPESFQIAWRNKRGTA